jgi:hypothetical protein
MDQPPSDPLFAPIARGDVPYCVEVAPLERLMVRIDLDGVVLIKGQRVEIEALLALLRKQGLLGEIKYFSFCG